MGSEVPLQAVNVYRHLVKATADPSSVLQKINLARDYAFMLNSIHHHKDLLFSYNIAVDRSDDATRTLTKSAASVGLQLPDVHQS
ncbi:hypothetical protein Sjap_007295 [Stephania japonica]|uniref:Uncharacterized protein n=1 Tax=Stephania japonica TaxID=461633 RepID=A0AAP0JMB7_9MAGN